MVVHYELLSVSSEDEEAIEKFRKEQPSVLRVEGNGVCWISEKNRGYPQSLIIKLEETVDIFRIDVVAHPQFIPSSMTVSFGLPTPGKHRNTTGNSYDADYVTKGQIYFVEDEHVNTKQTLLTNGPAHYIRFTTHGIFKTLSNTHTQVGIISIVLNGTTSSGGLSFSSNPSTPSTPRDNLSSSFTMPSFISSVENSPVTSPRPDIWDSPPSPRPLDKVDSSTSPLSNFIANPPPKSLRNTMTSPHNFAVSPYVDDFNNKSIAAVRPISRATVEPPPMIKINPINLNGDDSDEEEIIFTRKMITRLNDKLIEQGEKPVIVSDEKYKRRPQSRERAGSATKKPDSASKEQRPTSGAKKEIAASLASNDVLSASELESVLRDIESFEGDMDPSLLGINPDGANIVNDKKYYFRSRLAELHNMLRLLDQRKEEALSREQYSQAGGIDKCLQKLRLREEPLKELLIERMDALQKGDYDEAQVQKDRFELNLEAALDIPELKQFVSAKEMSRIRKEAKTSASK